MCGKCDELDGKIEHYRKLASATYDRLALDGIADRIKEIEAQQAQLHPACAVCKSPMGLVVSITDPRTSDRVRHFECPKCRNMAFIRK